MNPLIRNDAPLPSPRRILAQLTNIQSWDILKNLKGKTMGDIKWSFVSIATASLAHFILRTIIGRELGSDGLGVYTLAFTIYLLGMQFAAFGIGSALTKHVAEFLEDRHTITNYVSSGLTSSIITGAAMGVVLFLIAPYIATSVFHTPELEGMIKLISVCYPFIAIQKAVLGTLNGFRKMRRFAFLNLAQNISVVVLTVVLVLSFDMNVMGGIIGLVVPTVVVGLLSPVLIRDHIALDSSLWNGPALHATTLFGLYVVLGSSVGFLNTQIDNFFIGYYLNPSEVGIYAVAIMLVQTLTLVPTAIQQVTTPMIATLYGRGDVSEVRRLFYYTLKKSLSISFISAIAIAVAAPYMIAVIFTDAYSSSYTPLVILLVGYAVGASYGAIGGTLSSIGKVKIPFRISSLCAILNILLNVVLVPTIGINGAALATSATMIANFTITVWIVRGYLGSGG